MTLVDPDCLRPNPDLVENTARALAVKLDEDPAARLDVLRSAVASIYLAANDEAISELLRLGAEIDSARRLIGLLDVLDRARLDRIESANEGIRLATDRLRRLRKPSVRVLTPGADDDMPF